MDRDRDDCVITQAQTEEDTATGGAAPALKSHRRRSVNWSDSDDGSNNALNIIQYGTDGVCGTVGISYILFRQYHQY